MAKDKTKPRPGLDARREEIRKTQAAAASKRRRRIALNTLVAIVIVALAAYGITLTVMHVKAGERALAVDGDPKVQQITPPNASSDGLAILANPGVTMSSEAITVDLHLDFQSSTTSVALGYYGGGLTQLAQSGAVKLMVHMHISQDAQYTNTASGRAAIAAACADTVGKFWAYTQALMSATPSTPTAGQVGFTDAQLQQSLPSAIGITGDDLTKFQTCYTGRATSKFVENMDSLNQTTPVPNNTDFATGVTDVPTILANNQTVDIQTDMNNATDSAETSAALLQLLATTAGLM